MAAAWRDDRLYHMGCLYRMEGLVSELCIADRMFADSDFHGNRIQDTITFSEGVYDLLRDGVNVQYPSSFCSAAYKGDSFSGACSPVRRIEFFISDGTYFI